MVDMAKLMLEVELHGQVGDYSGVTLGGYVGTTRYISAVPFPCCAKATTLLVQHREVFCVRKDKLTYTCSLSYRIRWRTKIHGMAILTRSLTPKSDASCLLRWTPSGERYIVMFSVSQILKIFLYSNGLEDTFYFLFCISFACFRPGLLDLLYLILLQMRIKASATIISNFLTLVNIAPFLIAISRMYAASTSTLYHPHIGNFWLLRHSQYLTP